MAGLEEGDTSNSTLKLETQRGTRERAFTTDELEHDRRNVHYIIPITFITPSSGTLPGRQSALTSSAQYGSSSPEIYSAETTFVRKEPHIVLFDYINQPEWPVKTFHAGVSDLSLLVALRPGSRFRVSDHTSSPLRAASGTFRSAIWSFDAPDRAPKNIVRAASYLIVIVGRCKCAMARGTVGCRSTVTGRAITAYGLWRRPTVQRR